MAREVERKFLVADDSWRGTAGAGTTLRQAYLTQGQLASVRIRTVDASTAFLTVKSAEPGLSRTEYEYAIPVADAEAMFRLRTGSILEKVRFPVPHAGRKWEVDVYLADNEGLIVAEIELPSEADAVELPAWVGGEVTGDARYYAAALAHSPFRSWPAAELRAAR